MDLARPTVHYLSDHGFSGYSVAARRMMLGLDRIGATVHWTPLHWLPQDPILSPAGIPYQVDRPRADPAVQADVVVVHTTPEFLPALRRVLPPGPPLLLHVVWEFDRLPADWPALCNTADGLIVPTRWNAEAFAAAGVRVPILVVPHAHDYGVDEPDGAWLDSMCPPEDLLLHSIARWDLRKNPAHTVAAYARAFGPADATTLLLKTSAALEVWFPPQDRPAPYRFATSWSIAEVMHRHAPAPRLHAVTGDLEFAQIAGLHRRSDCWISLPHAEGWDLGCFDAAVHGCPVVTTAHGAPLEYLDPDLSYLVPARLAPSSLVPGADWAVPDLDVAVDMLRAIRADPQAAADRAALQAARLRREYDPARVATVFVEQLATLGLAAVG